MCKIWRWPEEINYSDFPNKITNELDRNRAGEGIFEILFVKLNRKRRDQQSSASAF